MYYKLKTSFLEETLGEALEDDSFDLSLLETSSQQQSSLTNSLSEISTPDLTQLTNNDSSLSFVQRRSTLAELNCSDDKNNLSGKDSTSADSSIVETEQEKYQSLNSQAWGSEMNVKPVISSNSVTHVKEQKETGSKLRKSMSDKLFQNSSFLKRNPRKSLSKSNLQSYDSSSSLREGDRKESLPDLETILSQKSMKEKEEEGSEQIVVNPLSHLQHTSNLANSIDQEWLNRCNHDNGLAHEPQTQCTSNVNIISNREPVYGLVNIRSSTLGSLEAAVTSETIKKTIPDSGVKDPNLGKVKSLLGVMPLITDEDIDDVDEIANSEDELNTEPERKIRSIRVGAMKRKHSETNADSHAVPNKTNSKPVLKEKTVEAVKRQVISRKSVKKNVIQHIPVPKRQSLRKAKKVPNYSNRNNQDEVDDDDGELDEESDPFGGEDSDNDPEFTPGDKKSKRENSRRSKGDQESFSSSECESVPDNGATSLKKTVKKKVVKTIEKKIVRKSSESRKIGKPVTKAKNDEDASESTNQTDPSDYLMEFNPETIKSLPRIDIRELEKTTEAFNEFISKATVSTRSNNNTTVEKDAAKNIVARPTTRQATGKEKMEKKIAAGTLNENFVRINLRKKVFVRGKKQMSFSRYKKTMWKNKKQAAALSGPEMDMGGCDGGILVCFQCGMPGHFAQNCRVKSKF